MIVKKRVMLIGLKLEVVDFSNWHGLTSENLMYELKTSETTLKSLGYNVELCLVNLDGTAEVVVIQKLTKTKFDCVMIGAGVRTIPEQLLLFERLINIVHQYAHSVLCRTTHLENQSIILKLIIM